jgi:hypothetical protein
MKAVSRRDLAVLVVGLALATWLLVRVSYGELPPLRWWLPAPLALLAVAEAGAARTLSSRLRDLRTARAVGRGRAAEGAPRPERVRPVEPMLVARMAVLAQASAYVGAVLLGVWLGVLAHVGPSVGRLQAAGNDTITAILGVVSAAALLAAALWLESACKVPPDDEGDGGPLAPHA